MRNKAYETSLSKRIEENISYIFGGKLISSSHAVIIGTAAVYMSNIPREYYGDTYNGDLDIAVTKEYITLHKNFEDLLLSEGFVKGAIIEKPSKKILGYTLMKENKVTKEKEIDILLGSLLESPFFSRPLHTRKDINEISKKYKIKNISLNVLSIEYQLAEKIMLPSKKRAKTFDSAFRIALRQGNSISYLSGKISDYIKSCARNEKAIEKWWKQLKNFNYVFGEPEIKSKKQRFFKYLKQKLNL